MPPVLRWAFSLIPASKYFSTLRSKKTLKFFPVNPTINYVSTEEALSSIKSGDRVYIQGPTTGSVELVVQEIRVDLKTVTKTVKGEACSIACDTLLRRADKVYKIINTKD